MKNRTNKLSAYLYTNEELHLNKNLTVYPGLMNALVEAGIQPDLSKLNEIGLAQKGNPEDYKHDDWYPVRTDNYKIIDSKGNTKAEIDWAVVEGVDSAFILHELDNGDVLVNFTNKVGRRNEVIAEVPGGRIDKGETPEQGARRELEEEFGFPEDKIKSIQYLGETNKEPDRQSTKFHYFYSRGGSIEDIKPQKLEDAENIVPVIIQREHVWKILKNGGSLPSEGILSYPEVMKSFYKRPSFLSRFTKSVSNGVKSVLNR